MEHTNDKREIHAFELTESNRATDPAGPDKRKSFDVLPSRKSCPPFRDTGQYVLDGQSPDRLRIDPEISKKSESEADGLRCFENRHFFQITARGFRRGRVPQPNLVILPTSYPLCLPPQS